MNAVSSFLGSVLIPNGNLNTLIKPCLRFPDYRTNRTIKEIGLYCSVIHCNLHGRWIFTFRISNAVNIKQRFRQLFHLLSNRFLLPVLMDDTGDFPVAREIIHLVRLSSDTLIRFRTVPLMQTGFISSINAIAVRLATPILSATWSGFNHVVI